MAMTYILERGIQADLALVKAWKADRHGNLIYRRTARNFNPNAASCGKVTVAEAEIACEPGELDPDEIHTPGIFVHRLVHNPEAEEADREDGRRREALGLMAWTRNQMAARAAREIERRLLREPRHRDSDAGGESHSRRHDGDAAVGEWTAGHGAVSARSEELMPT